MDFITNILGYVFWVGLALGILIFIHELGHFLAAKAFGMRVERFSIGFPPRMFGKQIGETDYQVGWIPLGGYVSVSGIIDESMNADSFKSEPEPYEYRAKPVWQKMIFITNGVIFNMILAFFILSAISWSLGDVFLPAEHVDTVYVADGSIAADMGMQTGDRITSVNDSPLKRFDELITHRTMSVDPMVITVDRKGQTLDFEAPSDIVTQMSRMSGGTILGNFGIHAAPFVRIGGVSSDSGAEEAGISEGSIIKAVDGKSIRTTKEFMDVIQASAGNSMAIDFIKAPEESTDIQSSNAKAKKSGDRFLLGVNIIEDDSVLYDQDLLQRRSLGLGQAIAAGFISTIEETKAMVGGFKKILSGKENLRETVGGPVLIAKVTKEAANRSSYDFWRIVALLSITLAVMNILPIPALDGGHLVFLIYEAVTRREPSIKFRMIVQQIGLVLILGFMAFVIVNDFLRL